MIRHLVFAATIVAVSSLSQAEDLSAIEIPVATPGTDGLISASLIYDLEGRPTPQCHASTIVASGESLVAAWFGGTHEKHNDVGIWVARNDGDGWSKPVEVVNGVQSAELRYPCWNPVLFQPDEGPLLLFYKVGPSPSKWWGMLTTSTDHGKTWSPGKRLGENEKIGNLLGPVKNKPIQQKDGSIWCPSSTEHQGWRVHFEVTKDLGKTWRVVGPINDAKRFNAIQPSILSLGDEKLQILCRTKEGVVAQSHSEDSGETWSKLTGTKLPNPNAGTDAITLADGRHLLVYNHTTRSGKFPSGRNMLNVAVSNDGAAWSPVMTLERAEGEYSYPAVIQTADGRIHVTYTYQRRSVKHAVLDPTKLRERK